MKILIFGKSGQVGLELQKLFQEQSDVLALGKEDEGGDLTKLEAMVARIKNYRPDIVFNAAAYTAVDKAESERELAYLVNAEAVGVMAQACKEIDAVLVHYSTDYVFDGEGSEKRTEDAQTAPLNYYGVSKLAGEEAIWDTACKALIFRTSWVYADHGHNFIKTMLHLAKNKVELNVVGDQIGAPTSASFIAAVSGQLGCRATNGEVELCGTYNLVPHGETNWCDLARYVVAYADKAGVEQTLKTEDIHAISSAEYPTLARRPMNSRLNNEKMCKAFDGEVKDWKFYADEVLTTLVKEKEN